MWNTVRRSVDGRIRRYLTALTCLGLAGFAVSHSGRGNAAAPAPAFSAQVVGTLTLATSVEGQTGGLAIELPLVHVFLLDARTGLTVAQARTQLDGKFHLPAPGPGAYQVCWKSPHLGSGCGTKLSVQADSVFLGKVPAVATPGLIHGQVLTADGRPCWVHDPFFGLKVETRLALLDSGNQVVRKDVPANAWGEYAIGGVKPGRYRVLAECEKSAAQASVSLGGSPAVADLTLPNRAPHIVAMSAYENGQGVTRAAAGGQVKVNATTRDADLDPIEHRWRLVDGSGAIPGLDAPQQDWKLPTVPGRHALYLMARDGKGGYAFKRFDLQVGDGDLVFSGRAIDETTLAPVPNAGVEVNGVTTTTNAQGWFSLSVPPDPAPERYVMNIRHPLYALLSRIHDKEAAGNTYQLIRAQTTFHDPGRVIDVVDTGSGGPCGSPGGRDQPPAGTPRDPRKDPKDPENPKDPGRTTPGKPDERPCRHRGARVVIPAGTLVDASQNPAQGPVKMAFATLNPARRALPGDYRAVDATSLDVELLSFGALFAEFRDANDAPLNLKPGSPALIQVPVSDEQLPFAAPTIAVWSYDEKSGLWLEESKAVLKNTAAGWMYEGKTAHFSTINMDVAGSDPDFATCVRLEVGSSLSGWNDLVLRAYVSYGGDSVQVKETALDGAQYHAIFRIPYSSPPASPPNTLRLELRGTYGGQLVVLLDDIINTDARPKMTGTDLWPDSPYAECGDPIVLEADPVNLPYYGDIDATGRPAFLTGPNGKFLPEDGEATATAYYTAIDPGDDKTDLEDWWTLNGFAADGTGGTRAAYVNHNDLGFGRDMNCVTSGSDLACYVTNYGAPDQNPANADAAEDGDATQRGATVAMEYIAGEPADRRVRFFAYGGGVAASPRIKFADLDGLGPKPVPHLCLVCHGGQFDDASAIATHARFREFDLPSFKYSEGRSWDFAPVANTLQAAELTAFAGLNEMVRDIAPATSPIGDLIDEWYPGGFGPGTAPVLPDVPPGWSTEVNGYHDVYAQSCRTCHVARDEGVADAFLTFGSSTNFGFTDYVVCGSPKVMPNAYITYKNFWSDLQRVIDYTNLTGGGTCE